MRSEIIYEKYALLSYGFSKFSILIVGWQAVRKNPYPDRGPYFPVSRMSFIWREIFALQTEKNFAF
jgi:hypothetical protein